ncbi:hypothetical protein BZA05DRAFT_422805 [Tricharina praecox]|uniref:uncharacterized protein n=1 Tax=Tricharina praecox TaxID=43433 RepID=UPI00221F44E4|nr:uncharacterized protein BZA05DRAFT_422805 [Tricharina praecox]KAI5841602.1 hypothetical protein BZA05DRAFT_422805 [Tricharina praecox]
MSFRAGLPPAASLQARRTTSAAPTAPHATAMVIGRRFTTPEDPCSPSNLVITPLACFSRDPSTKPLPKRCAWLYWCVDPQQMICNYSTILAIWRSSSPVKGAKTDLLFDGFVE